VCSSDLSGALGWGPSTFRGRRAGGPCAGGRAPRRDVRRERIANVATGRAPAGTRAVGAPSAERRRRTPGEAGVWPPASGATGRLIAALADLEARGAEGIVELPGGESLAVTHLDKTYWPGLGLSKGTLLRYYAWAAPYLLPLVSDRPLVMRRFPDGVRGKAFYQQRAVDDAPAGVRIERLGVDTEVPSRLIGGSLLTLLYMAQIAAISQDPWFSRVGTIDDADHAVLDLDPMPGVPFATVVDVARFIHDELERIGTPSVPKTSGASGMHIYIPLPPRTSYETGRIFCEIVATLVADRHPRMATVERAVDARGRRVYIDYMQNFRGKTLATAYSARGTDFAGVSTPLTWREVHAGVDAHDFTLLSVPDRVRGAGDLWATLRDSAGANLGAILRAQPTRRKKR